MLNNVNSLTRLWVSTSAHAIQNLIQACKSLTQRAVACTAAFVQNIACL